MARILIIDDDGLIRDLLAEALIMAGHEVLTAPDGQEGLDLLQDRPMDMVITDLLMPEKEGLETILAVKADFPWIKIIAISGGGQIRAEDYLKVAKLLGADRTLTKPFEMAQFHRLVEEALALPRSSS